MKRKLFIILTALITVTSTIPTSAKTSKYYSMSGTVKNFTYTMRYNDGTVLTGKGYDIYTTDGNIFQMVDTDTDSSFPDDTRVKVKLNDNGTWKDKTDDIIVSVRRSK